MHGAIFRYRGGLGNNFRRYSLYKSKTDAIWADSAQCNPHFDPSTGGVFDFPEELGGFLLPDCG
jgi:hypothetical protein